MQLLFRKLILISIPIFISFSLYSQHNITNSNITLTPNLNWYRLNDHVKEIETFRVIYSIREGVVTGSSDTINYTPFSNYESPTGIFSPEGNILNAKFYNDSGQLYSEKKYTYDIEANIISETLIITGNPTYESVFNYNSNSVIEVKKKNGKHFKTINYTLNINNLITKMQIESDGVTKNLRINEYYSDGRIKSIQSGSGNEINSITNYIYDEDNLLSKTEFIKSGEIISEKFFINHNGLLVRVNHKPGSYSTYHYDNFNQLIKVFDYLLDVQVEYEYIYDDNGNWIRRIKNNFKGGLLRAREEIIRKIDYY